MKVTDEELLVLERLPIAANTGTDLEMARRNTAAIGRSIESLANLRSSIEDLLQATNHATMRTNGAIESLESSVDSTTDEIGSLRTSVELLHKTTRAMGAASTEAIGQLEASIKELRAATDTWSTWLTRLTIGLFGLTLLLVALTVAQVVNR